MKKSTILITSITGLILTFVFIELFSIYHFGTVPTLLTFLYIISIFSIIEYLLLSITYVIKKIITKEKIEIKKIIGLILLFLALLLILLFIIVTKIDWINKYIYSTPFYINLIMNIVKYLLPSIILIIISILLMKKKK